MKVVLFGASGMVRQGILRKCLEADDVTQVTVVGRTAVGSLSPKISELILPDLFS